MSETAKSYDATHHDFNQNWYKHMQGIGGGLCFAMCKVFLKFTQDNPAYAFKEHLERDNHFALTVEKFRKASAQELNTAFGSDDKHRIVRSIKWVDYQFKDSEKSWFWKDCVAWMIPKCADDNLLIRIQNDESAPHAVATCFRQDHMIFFDPNGGSMIFGGEIGGVQMRKWMETIMPQAVKNDYDKIKLVVVRDFTPSEGPSFKAVYK